MMKTWIWAGVAAIAGLALTGAARADIVIATAGPMSGQYALFGELIKAGAEQAVADINKAGGVNGEKLVLEIADDECDAEKAVAIANQMVGKGAVFMAGHFCSEPSIAASAVYAKEGIVEMSPGAGNPKYTDERPGPGIYRLGAREDQQGKTVGTFLAENYKGKNIAILHDSSVYGKGLADAAKAVMNDAGVFETLYEAYPPGEKDYSRLVSKLKGEAVDALFIGGFPAEAGLIKRQMEEQGMDTVLVSGEALLSDEYWAISGPAGEGTLVTYYPDPRKIEAAGPVIAELEKAGKPSERYALVTYAAIQIFAQAAEAAGSTDFKALVNAIDDGDFSTILGPVSFEEKGDSSLPGYVWYEWKNGKYDYK